MIPPFQPDGKLPSGIHDSSWEDAAERFGVNPYRACLLRGLLTALRSLRRAGCLKIYLDGSFVTDKEFPNDFDVAWETGNVSETLLRPIFLDFSNLRQSQKETFGANSSLPTGRRIGRAERTSNSSKPTGMGLRKG